ncbi:MAG TPA: hypothetical protein VIJ86_11515 [Acidimicrobiales bacterium]
MNENTYKVVRWSLLRFLTAGAVGETIWTVYIAFVLPRHYDVNHWDIAWVGLDVAQILMLSLSAWAAWRRNTLLVMFATVSATLLLVDAWFDVTTARRGDLSQSIVLAVLIEVPSAIVLYAVAHRGLRHTVMLPVGASSGTKRMTTFEVTEDRDSR